VHAAGREDEPIDWLVYHHGRSPVTDLCGYNPSQPRREEDVHPVTDLRLSFRLGDVSGSGTFRVRASDGRDSFEARLTFDGDQPRYRVYRNGRPLSDAPGKFSAAGGNRLVEVSLVDQQFLLAVDGQTLWAESYERPEPPPIPPSSPLAIGVQGLQVTIGGLRIDRDVYYTDPMGSRGHRRGRRAVRLGTGQYYVLGDNSPVSEDSRRWPEWGEVDAKLLVGKPLAAVTPTRLSLAGWWHFQVPNPAQIRYIW
jgi:signal peptidase I